jgi:uracil-DNA glycosylase family protein
MTTERPGARWWVPDGVSTGALRSGIEACQGCELYRDATHGVPGRGPQDASLMLVGEQPGDDEDRAGEPFVGPAGKLLNRALAEAGVPPESVFLTNVVKHFRWSGTRGKRRIHQSPSRVHVTACGPWLVAELSLVRPSGIVLLGGTAGKAVFGTSFRVGESRGRMAQWPVDFPGFTSATPVPDWVLPTLHPAAVLRSRDRDADYQTLVDDLTMARSELGAA